MKTLLSTTACAATFTLALLATPMLVLPAAAETSLEGDIVSSAPEGQEDCEALRERLRGKRDDNVLAPADMRELRDRGC